MTALIKYSQIAGTSEEAAALASLSIAAELVEGSAYALAGTRPGRDLTYLFLLAANIEKEVQRISATTQS